MKNSDLQNRLNELWAGVIESFEISIIMNSISLKINVIDDGQEDSYDLIFNEVSSYYFVNDRGEQRWDFKLEEGDYLELTSIYFYENGFDIKIESLEKEWIKQYYSRVNFSLEIWSSMLFIEAKSVSINEKKFKVIC